MKFARLHIVLIVLTALLLTACAGRDRQPVYLESEEVEPIRTPAHLDEPMVRRTYFVDGVFLPQMAGQSDPRPPRVLSSAEAEASRSRIRFGPSGLYLEVQDPADNVWQRLGESLDSNGMALREVEENEQRYAFHFDHDPIVIDRRGLARLVFWRSPEKIDHSGRFVVEVEPADAQTTRVQLLTEDKEPVEMQRAEYVLSVLRERLG